MLDDITTQTGCREVFRLSRKSANEDNQDSWLVDEFQVDPLGVAEIHDILPSHLQANSLDELLDKPFKHKRDQIRRSRFSDGSFPVFYSSLDAETAQAEMKYWLPEHVKSQTQKSRTIFFQQFSCTFDGKEKDLRSKIGDWPDLVHESDYTFCNHIGSEAMRLKIDGLVSYSARRNYGVNAPIFSRTSISKPKRGPMLAMTFKPDTEEIIIEQIDG